MDLFVVGATSPNAEDWSIWSEVKVVIAENEDAARKLIGTTASVKVTRIPMDKEQILRDDDEPDWGDDL